MKKKKSVKRNISKKKSLSNEQKLFGALAIGIGIFLIFGFALNLSNITGQVTSTGIVADLKSLGEGVVKILEPLAKTLLGGNVTGEMLFAKVLFFLIVFGIIYLALEQVPFFSAKRGISFLIVASASILAVRWIGDSQIIQTILLPYSALGIVVSAGLPFIIYFLVINKGLVGQPPLVRQTAWVFFAIVFIGLYFSRSSITIFSWVYPITALLAIIIALMDGTIKKYFLKIEGGKAKIEINKKALSRFKMELVELTKEFQDTGLTPAAFKARQKVIQDKILALSED